MANFVSYANAQDLMGAIAARFAKIGAAFQYRGTTAFADLPATLTADMSGYVYNITDAFTTDSRFIEGAGKSFSAGTDVCIVNIGTKDTPDMKLNVAANFIDLTPVENNINKLSGDIAPAFDQTKAYSEGDKVMYEGQLYIFTAAKSAGAWDATKATSTDVVSLIASAEPDSLTAAQITALEGLLD